MTRRTCNDLTDGLSSSLRAGVLCVAVLGSALLAVEDAHAQTTVAGFTPGSFAVSPSGAATYTIPIQVPPGIAGMQPQLALSYNSQAGNGLLGMGWNLSGLSAVTRCPRTMVQDGVIGGINYDLNDRYCLDGQRLVMISGASYGADSAEYRTEQESFTKVISYGVAGNGPAWFKVWTKSGQIMEYGNTADSRIEAQGKPSVRVWARNKLSDTKGNYLTVTYTEDNANGDYYPARIDYTGNASTAQGPTASVQFVYQARTDVTPFYQAGSVSKTLNRLTDVKTYTGTSLVKDYQLTYDQSVSSLNSRLTQVKECDGAETSCLQAITLAWLNGTTTLSQMDYNSPALPNMIGGYYNRQGDSAWELTGDFNGDGKADLMYMPGNGDGRFVIAYGTSTGYTQPDYNNPALPATLGGYPTHADGSRPYQFVADFNGDGKSDYMWMPSGGDGRWLIAYGTDTGLTQPDYNNPALPNYVNGYLNRNGNAFVYDKVADFNGDGRADYMWIPDDGDGRRLIAYGSATGFVLPDYNNPALPNMIGGYYNRQGDSAWELIGDFDGDGRADLLYMPGNGDGRFLIAYGTDTGFTQPDYNNPVLPATIGGYPTHAQGSSVYQYVADFNGDGKSDYMWMPTGGDGRWLIAYGNGTGFVLPDYNSPALPNYVNGYLNRNGLIASDYMQVGDFNGDGKSDYFWIPDNGDGRWLIAYGTGTGFTLPDYNSPALPNMIGGYYNRHGNPTYQKLGDFNGDGKTDYMWIPGNGDGRRLIAYGGNAVIADLVASVTGGLNNTSTMTYKPLTDGAAYSKDNSAVYPYVDMQAPMYVVSSASSSNGVGGTVTTNYFYTGAKAHQLGGGFLGFRKFDVTDAQTGIKLSTSFRQDYPFQGMPMSVVKTQPSGAVLDQVTNTWTDNPGYNALGYSYGTGNYHRCDLTNSVETSNDLNNAPLPGVTTTTGYDAYGNATSIVVGTLTGTGTSDGYSKSTTNTYTNDTANWFLGRLTRSQVTSTTP